MHVLTGPIFVEGAEPGDLLKVTIQDLQPRVNPEGKTYGSNANAWWGFQARVPQADGTDFDAGDFTDTPGSNDETVTIYEFMTDSTGSYAWALCGNQNFDAVAVSARWRGDCTPSTRRCPRT